MLETVESVSREPNGPSSEDIRVGVLVEVTGESFSARLDTAGTEAAAAKGMTVGQVGSYLKIRSATRDTLVMVDRSYRVTDKQGHPVQMVQLSPLGELPHSGGFERGVSQYPASDADLYTIQEANLENIFNTSEGAEFHIGQLTSFDSIDVHMDASAFFGRHSAILGQSGSGKSWTVTSVIQSALRSMPQAHIILLDMHGEYCDKEVNGIVSKAPFPADLTRSFRADELEFPYWLLSFSEFCELVINSEDEHASVQMSYLRSTLTRLKEESNAHLGLGHITVDSPLYYSIKELMDNIKSANRAATDFGKKKSPLNGKFDQVMVRLEGLMNDTRYDFMMKPSKRNATEKLPDLMRDLVGLGSPSASITILDLSSVPFDVAPLVCAQIGRLAYEFNYWNPRCTEFPIFLVCEEAHEYIPREGMAKFNEARRAMERISKNGRKYGVGLCVVSQRPADVSETVLAQCSSFLCLRISNPDDQAYVRAMVPDAARGTFSALTSLSKGEAVILGEAAAMPVRLKVRMPDPPPNSVDLDYAGKWRDGGLPIDVDQMVANWHAQER